MGFSATLFIILTNLLVNYMNIVSSENSPFMSGFYTDGLDRVHDKAEIVYPERVSKDGLFVSHYLPHYYNVESLDNRPKRAEGSAKDAIHFYVPIDGIKYHLELWPNLDFIAPSLVVERRDARDVENVNKAKMSRISHRQCHYSGRIVGKPSSTTALSTCYGLAGYIRMPAGDEYFIEPVKDSKPTQDKEHPHVIYKRSGKDKHSGSNCLTKGRAKDALEERLQWEALFGDQVRKELTGTNINDLVQDKAPSQLSHSDNNQHSQVEDQSMNLNSLKIMKSHQQKNNLVDSLINDLHKTYGKVRNDVYTGERLKQKPVKDQINMGTLNQPDISLQSSKGIPSQLTDNNVYHHIRLETGPQNKDDKYQKRLKRSTDNEIDAYNYEIEDSDKSDNLNKMNKPMAQHILEQNSINERCRRDSTSQSTFKQTHQNGLNTGNSAEDNQNLNIANVERYSENKEKLKYDQSNEEKSSLHQRENDKQLKESNSINSAEGGTNIDAGVPDNSQNNESGIKASLHNQKQENNVKREIHLDTSENSWQVADDASKLNEKSDKIQYKNSCKQNGVSFQNSANPTKTLEDNSDPTLKQSQDENKEQIFQDDKMMASVFESVVKGIEKTKIKKEISERDNSAEADYMHQQPLNIKVSTKQDDEKYVPFDQICLSNNDDKDVNSKRDGDTPKLVFFSKEAAGDLSIRNNQQPYDPVSHKKSNPNHVDEVVIRIKTPEGSPNDVKHVDSEVRMTKHDLQGVNILGLHNENGQNIPMDKPSFQTLAKEKNKREILNNNDVSGESNKLTNTKKRNEGKQDLNIEGDHQGFNIIIEQQAKSKDNIQHKTKRDDNTIHLIIEPEPEINNDNNNNLKGQKSGLFCQGKNCLEIKPVVLNDTIASVASNYGTNVETSRAKIMEKRQAFPGECTPEVLTEPPLICMDVYSKMFALELMVTVDYKVVKLHEDDDIENFILTIMNMVSTNFYDNSVGINLSVVLVRLILLTTCIKELDSDRFNPEELLENFCTWQVLINPGKDDHPHHHDLAILVTRMERCEGQVMGVTYMTSVCRPDKACLVCIDEGMLLANTITHQIGHSLGADHDDGSVSGCAPVLPDGTSFHMNPTITETSSAWSTCSRDAIIQFVKTQGSWCLTDLPVERTFNFPLMLPGQIYTAAQQCKLNFHMTSFPCAVGSFCEKLYCQVTEKLCATKGDPPADGTFCASDMWCFHKQCVHIGRRPGAINGEWGPWTEWTVCTRSCGGGVSSSYRICNKPKPEKGGRYCIGDRIRNRMCATTPCQGFSESFRDLQCKRTEDRPFRGKFHNWLQYQSFFLNIECALACQNRKGEVVMRSPIVADGTPCKAGTRNVCIQGTCRIVGCDWVIDSNAKEDACGICHGNGTECRIIQGVFDEDATQKGLVEFLRIPKDSGMVFVREAAPSQNMIVVTGAINRVYYLNSPSADDSMPGDVSFGLTHGVYEMRSAMERVFIRGPTTEDLIFHVLFREPNKGIHYQFAIPETDPTYVPRYLWQYLDWDPCTDPCSGGSQRAHPKCVEDRGGVVDDQYCTDSTKPIDIIRPCNDFPCQPKWWVSVWSDCICTGSTSIMFRSVLCMRATDESGTRSEIVKEVECADHKKPQTQKACNATDEDNECVNKRSADEGAVFSTPRNIRAISPKTVYAQADGSPVVGSPADGTPGIQEGEMVSNIVGGGKQDIDNDNKNGKKSIKTQNNKNLIIKNVVNKLKPKLSDKALDLEGKKNIAAFKSKEASNQKANVASKSVKDSKPQVKLKEAPLAINKGKQTAKLNSKESPSISEESNSLKDLEKSKQAVDSDSDAKLQDCKVEEKCETSPEPTCHTEVTEPSECSSCKQTCPILPHKRTTCCKTTPRRLPPQCPEVTTLRPVPVKLDELNTHEFGLTIIPLEPKKKNLPQSDPEFINLGNLGQFGVANEDNGHIIQGQEAIDFLEFVRNNATQEPVILHDLHN